MNRSGFRCFPDSKPTAGFGLAIAASGAVRKLSSSASGGRPEMYAAVAGATHFE